MSDVQNYITRLLLEKSKAEGHIENYKRSLSRVEEKLRDPEKWLAIELKRGGVKAHKSIGKDAPKKIHPLIQEIISSPAPVETTPEVEPKKKNSWALNWGGE